MRFGKIAPIVTVALTFWLASCQQTSKIGQADFYGSDFFREVQLSDIFSDSKTFVDCTPKRSLGAIIDDYEREKETLDLKSFVMENFELPAQRTSSFVSDTTKTMTEHIVSLWPVLTQNPDEYDPLSSLISLPKSYIVPGGRFREIYYWDSYFTQLGLVITGQEEVALNMVQNFSFLIDSIGFIPNGNRAYYAGRSQPPFYSLMVKLVSSDNRDQFIEFLPSLVKEYDFWMTGAEALSPSKPTEDRVVLMPDSTVLNRYWDKYALPRPESFKEDYELVKEHGLDPEIAYRDLRAGAESGWDYSSRWFKDGEHISTIHTTEIIPVDLNCLLYHLELMIAQGYNWKGEVETSRAFILKAEARKKAILKYLWDDESQFFVDYDFKASAPTGILSLAGVYPLFFQLATKQQAKSVTNRLGGQFLTEGGFVSTLKVTGEQWDAPNGWAPLQWMTVNGLYNYGYAELGNEGAKRWVSRNKEVYKATGKMMEKYNVMDTGLLAGGGEYALQDGFGWTNGVALAMEKIFSDQEILERAKR